MLGRNLSWPSGRKNRNIALIIFFNKMNKKAASILMVIFELLAVLLVVFIVTEAAARLGDSEKVKRINMAQDIQMMLDTLLGVPGEAVVEYPGNLSSYLVLLSQKEITVFKRGEIEEQREKRDLKLPEGYTAAGSLEEKARLCLEKKDKAIYLRECRPEESHV